MFKCSVILIPHNSRMIILLSLLTNTCIKNKDIINWKIIYKKTQSRNFYEPVVTCEYCGSGWVLCNISNTRTSVPSCFQTLRTEVEKWGAAEFFNKSSRCLETWWNTSASVWYSFSNKYVLQEKTKEKVWLIYASVSSCFQTRHACDFPLS